MGTNYNTINAFNSFELYLKRNKVKSARKLATHIFNLFFSLTKEIESQSFQIVKETYFKDGVGFEQWRKNLIQAGVIEIVHRKKSLHKLGEKSMKYLEQAKKETSLFPNPLDMMVEIKKLRKEVDSLKDWKAEVEQVLPETKKVHLRVIK